MEEGGPQSISTIGSRKLYGRNLWLDEKSSASNHNGELAPFIALVEHAEFLHLVVKRNAADTEFGCGIFAVMSISS